MIDPISSSTAAGTGESSEGGAGGAKKTFADFAKEVLLDDLKSDLMMDDIEEDEDSII